MGPAGLSWARTRSPRTRKSRQRARPAGPSPGPRERPAGRGGGAEQQPPSIPPHRDAQRVEELCAKNHQLREQQKALKGNVRALENRWAGGGAAGGAGEMARGPWGRSLGVPGVNKLNQTAPGPAGPEANCGMVAPSYTHLAGGGAGLSGSGGHRGKSPGVLPLRDLGPPPQSGPASPAPQAAGRPVRPLHRHAGARPEEAAGVRELAPPAPAAHLRAQ